MLLLNSSGSAVLIPRTDPGMSFVVNMIESLVPQHTLPSNGQSAASLEEYEII